MPKSKQIPSQKTRELLAKLEALAARGIDGERVNAQKKLDRLRGRYDFTAPVEKQASAQDMFTGYYSAAPTSVPIATIADCDIANSVKWAIESATGIRCGYRDNCLAAFAKPASAVKLVTVANEIGGAFTELWRKFSVLPGLSGHDRQHFMMDLYDGMMGERREIGSRLPSKVVSKKVVKAKKRDLASAPGIAIHPYSFALPFGQQIRFSVPLVDIAAELERKLAGQLGN